MQDQSGATATRSGGVHSGRRLWAIGIALCVVTLLGCGIAIWDLHRQVIEQNRVAVTNLGVVLAEQTARYVQVVNLALAEVQSRVASLGVVTPDEFVALFGTEATQNFLRERLHNLPQANSFFSSRPMAACSSHRGHSGRLIRTCRIATIIGISSEHDDLEPFISAPRPRTA